MNSAGKDSKTIAIIAYFTLLGWFVALALNSNNKSSFASFHIRQAFGIHMLAFASAIILGIPILGWIVGLLGYVLTFLLWIIGLMAAVNGKEKVVPALGAYFQKWFYKM